MKKIIIFTFIFFLATTTGTYANDKPEHNYIEKLIAHLKIYGEFEPDNTDGDFHIYSLYDDLDFNGENELLLLYGEQNGVNAVVYDKNDFVGEIELPFSILSGGDVHSIEIAKGKTGIYLRVDNFTQRDSGYDIQIHNWSSYYKYKNGSFFEETDANESKIIFLFEYVKESIEQGDLNLEDLPIEVQKNYNNGNYKNKEYTYYESVNINGDEITPEKYKSYMSPYDKLDWTLIPINHDIEKNSKETINKIGDSIISDAKLPDLGENIKSTMDPTLYYSLIEWVSYSDTFMDESEEPARGYSAEKGVNSDDLVRLVTYPNGLINRFNYLSETISYHSSKEIDQFLIDYLGESFPTNTNTFEAGYSSKVERSSDKYQIFAPSGYWSYLPMYKVNGVYQIGKTYYLVEFDIHNLFADYRAYDFDIEKLKEYKSFEMYDHLTETEKGSLPKPEKHYAIMEKGEQDGELTWRLIERNSASNFNSIEKYKDKEIAVVSETNSNESEKNELIAETKEESQTKVNSNNTYLMYIVVAIIGGGIGALLLYLINRRKHSSDTKSKI